MNLKKAPCRVIDLIGTVNDEMLAQFSDKMRDIIAFDMEVMDYNNKVKPEFQMTYEPVRINLSTPGGSVMAGVGIMGIMDESLAPIHVHVVGSCMSMGISILAHAQTRTAVKFSSFMIHGMSAGAWGYLDESVQSLEYYKSLEKELNEELVKRTKYTMEDLEKYTNVAHFFSYQEALEKGLLTEDVYNKKQQPRFEREDFVECIMDDLNSGMSLEEIMKAFEGDNLYECEWDIVLDILAKLEEKMQEDEQEQDGEEKVEEVKEEEEQLPEEVDAEVNEDMIEYVEDYQYTLEELLEMFDYHFDEIEPMLNGNYTAKEIAEFMKANVESFEDVALDVIVDFLLQMSEDNEDE